MTNESNPPKRRGCLFYGCLSAALLGLLLLVMGAALFYVAKKMTNTWVRDYTDTTPGLIEKVEYTPAQLDELRRRLATFKQALDTGQESVELILTSEELNALVSGERDLRGKVFVRIENGQLKGDVSIPLHDIGPLKLNGRYLNGTAAFKASLANGALDVRLQEVIVKGKPLPPMFLTELKKQNLAENFTTDPKAAADIAKFESIQITNNQVILRTRGTAAKP